MLAKENPVSELGLTPPSLARTGAYAESRNAMILEKSTTSLQLLFPRPTRSGDCPGTMDTLARRKAKNPLEQSEVH